jgi:hypothetical protein
VEESKFSIQVTIIIDGAVTIKKVKMDSFVIGRHADCEVNVLHPQVSRQHLRISVIDNTIYFEDIGSSNGTFKDSMRVPLKKSFVLEPRDILLLGDEGPTIQVQFEEKKTSTALSVISSLMGAPRTSNKPPIPAAPAQVGKPKHVVASVASVLPQVPSFGQQPATVPSKDLKESEKTIQEANKQAAQILQKAQMQAEAKAQDAYKHAIETEQRAEKFYQDRLKEANDDAEKVYQTTRVENQKLLQEARAQAETLREQAESDARALRKTTEEKCAEFLKQAEMQGEAQKSKRLSEADEIIAKKGEDLLKATNEIIEKQKTEALKNLDSLKAQSSRAREQKVAFEEELIVLEKKINEAKSQYKINCEEAETSKQNSEKVQLEGKNLLGRLEQIKKENQELEHIHQKHKQDIEKLMLNLSSLKQEKENSEKEIHSQLQMLKEKIQQEKESINKKEADRVNELKLETAETVKKFEKHLVEEVVSRKSKISKEILLRIETLCASIALNDEWKFKQSDLDQVIQEVINGYGPVKSPARFSLRTKEKTFSVMLGLFIGMFVVISTQTFSYKLSGNSPVERMVASAVDAKKLDLETRKYNPPQTPEVKNNYVDSVIFTEKFSETYNDSTYQKAWNKAATRYLFKVWRLDEDHAAKALAISAALVKDLAERKEKIHPDFIKKNIAQMRDVEKDTLARLKTELGGEVRLESFKKFEKKFFENYDRSPAGP